jgi:hypothetical protein
MLRSTGLFSRTSSSWMIISALIQHDQPEIPRGTDRRDCPASRGLFSSRSICDDPFATTRFPQPRRIPGPSVCVFQAWRNLSVRCGQTTTKSRVETEPPPASRPRAQAKERAGRNTLFSSSAMSSDRLFLDRVGRHQSPSPLHRRSQNIMHSAEHQAKGDISTLPATRHFYFALTAHYRALCLTPQFNILARPRSCIQKGLKLL